MKVAVFSDIHGNYQALKSIIKSIQKNKIDKIVYLGDAVGLGPDSDKCLKLLYDLNVIFVLGNHELYCSRGHSIDTDMNSVEIVHQQWIDDNMKECKVIDDNNLKYEFTMYGKKFSFIHFFLDENKLYPYKHISIFKTPEYNEVRKNYNADYIFYGHFHEGKIDEYNNKHFYGIGSSGCVKNSRTYYYLIDIEKEETTIKKIKVNYDRKAFENRLNGLKYPNKIYMEKAFFGINNK